MARGWTLLFLTSIGAYLVSLGVSILNVAFRNRRLHHPPTDPKGHHLVLDMKATCERCEAALAADTRDARICSFECTFCAGCADEMSGTCPTCGGELVPRPARAA